MTPNTDRQRPLIDRLRDEPGPDCYPCSEWGYSPDCRCHDWQSIVKEAACEIERLQAVLAAPEMQNIRATLLHFARVCAYARGDNMESVNDLRRHLSAQGVLPSVAEWVVVPSTETPSP